MSLLKTPPGAPVLSIEEICAIAQALEHEAAKRYAELAIRARADRTPQLAELFERLAEEERRHEAGVLRWAQQRIGKPPDSAAIKWVLPEILDEEGAELAASKTATAYRVLSMAVRNEERAFTFWSYVASEAPTPELRAAAESMAREELHHVSLLRQARREAYHAERRRHLPDAALSIDDRLAEAAFLERWMAGQLAALATRLAGPDRERAEALAVQADAMSRELAVGPEPRRETGGTLDIAAVAERLVEGYLGVAEATKDESTALRVQSFAGQAITRLAWLRDLQVSR
ncbi:MAG: ferritin family protein [Reyranella sp.]|uniref:ferritin-like domain-containing protein n=1 Tax=Reyranella sp. TaxID=1929291 RepID=UPI003D1065EE